VRAVFCGVFKVYKRGGIVNGLAEKQEHWRKIGYFGRRADIRIDCRIDIQLLYE
jgi:hypothetical protein